MKDRLESLQGCIHHRFSQVKLLTEALTHSSHANESPGEGQDNERLEFLGDAVLELAVSEELFRRYPEADEGRLTAVRARMVREKTLAGLARGLGVAACLRLGRGEDVQGGRERDALLADALEAIFGAVFLDGGYAAARDCVLGLFEPLWPPAAVLPGSKDPKSRLQEMTQERFRERPVYVLAGSSGPDHGKEFTVRLTLPDGTEYAGRGPSVKKAEQVAATQALVVLEGEG